MVTRVSGGVFRLRLRASNAYLIDDGELTLVDAGTPWDAPAIRAGVRDVGGSLAALDRVLVTHYDVDHFGGLSALASDLDAPVYLGSPDAEFLRGDANPTLTHYKGLIQRAFRWIASPPDLPVRAVEDGEATGGIRAYRTPGHTPGHTVYLHRDLGAGFLGDLVATRDGEFVPVRRASNYDYRENDRSVAALAERAPEFGIACPGHGRPIVGGASRKLRAFAGTLAVPPTSASGA